MLTRLLGLILILLSVFLLIAFLSYSPNDPSIFLATDISVMNIAGVYGSYIVNPFIKTLGYSILLIIIFLFIDGGRLLKKQKLSFMILRISALFVSIPLFSIFLSSIDPQNMIDISNYNEANWGGSMGYYWLSELIIEIKLTIIRLFSFIIAIFATLLAFGIRPREYLNVLILFLKYQYKCLKFIFLNIKNIITNSRVSKGININITSKLKELYINNNENFVDEDSAQGGDGSNEDRKIGNHNIKINRDTNVDVNYDNHIKDIWIGEDLENNRGKSLINKNSIINPSAVGGATGNSSAANNASNNSKQILAKSYNKFTSFFENLGDSNVDMKQTGNGINVGYIDIDINDNFILPDKALLQEHKEHVKRDNAFDEKLRINAEILITVLEDFGVKGTITSIHPGPVVTLYELEPAAGTKSSRVIGLADDISRSISAVSARISVIPGKNAIGIEIPNDIREIVYLREILESDIYIKNSHQLPLVLGKNIGGRSIVADLVKMPHLLVAGTTGSGKSVAINTMILSLLYRYTPKECRLIMIDPKMLELSIYDGIPHLLAPVVTDPKKAVYALKWAVKEMETRYRSMSVLGVRNIINYNNMVNDAITSGVEIEKQIQIGFDEESGKPRFEVIKIKNEKLPYIVIIVDEMADLMLIAGKDIEMYIQRLAQMARAAGIHIIMATQRPSVDVITGVIKANLPTRISFQVTSKIDSRTILGEQGAEQLLGMGDMLHMMTGGRIERIHGPFVSDKEVENVVKFLKTQSEPQYVNDFINELEAHNDDKESDNNYDGVTDSSDLYEQAVAIVLRDKRPTTSYLQRCLRIGYNRAAMLIERMEKEGILSAVNHNGKRQIIGDD